MFRRVLSACALAAGLAASALTAASAAPAADCPEGGKVRFGVEPYESSQNILPIFSSIAAAIGEKIGCPVDLFIATSYNAEIEAMRNNKLDIAEYGPLGYIFAHQVANAEAFAQYAESGDKLSTYYASIVTWKGSGVTDLKGVSGKSFAYSDPASTSGHLFPAYAFRKNGIDPDTGIKPFYAGTHSASYEAIRNHKVDAGELNSQQIESAKRANEYIADDFVTLWQSKPIPNDPVTVRGSLPAPLKKRIEDAFLTLDFTKLPADEVKHLMDAKATHYAPQVDSAYDEIRDLAKTMNYRIEDLDKKK
jgi:phosphonate transport system substrate-binding protein